MVSNMYGVCGLSFLTLLITAALPTAKGGDVAEIQVHAGHVQKRLVTFQDYAPYIFLFTVPRPLAKMVIYGFVMQHRPCEAGGDRMHVPLVVWL